MAERIRSRLLRGLGWYSIFDLGQDQQDEQDGEQEQQPPPEGEDQAPPEGEQERQRQPGEMTPEEAERLLDAIREDPGDVNRKPAAARGRKPKKVW